MEPEPPTSIPNKPIPAQSFFPGQETVAQTSQDDDLFVAGGNPEVDVFGLSVASVGKTSIFCIAFFLFAVQANIL